MRISHWLNSLFSRGTSVSQFRLRRPRRLRVLPAASEALEERLCLAAVAWDGGGDGIQWTDPANWQGDTLPTAGDDVTISFGPNAIVLSSGNQAVKSLTTTNPLTLSGGQLTVVETLQAGGDVTLRGTTIVGGSLTITNGTQLLVSGAGGTLNGVTINGNLNFSHDTSITVLNGLTLNGTASLTNPNTWINFNGGTQSLTGAGTVVFGNNYSNGLSIGTQGSTFTIGAGITLQGGSSYTGGGRVLGNYNVSIVNQGTINADTAGSAIRILPGDGTGTLTNTGTINVSAGNVQLGGRFTQAMLGTVNRNGGSLFLSGTLDNTGDTLALSGASDSWTLQGGTILGGTVTTTNGAQLLVSSSSGTLDGVTLNGDLNFANDTSITVLNGLTLNGTADLTNANTWINFNGGTQSLTGTGTVSFGNNYSNGLNISTPGSTFTIGAGITLQGGSSYSGAGRVQGNYNVSIVNQGTINADAAGRTIRLLPGDGTGTLTNTGTINVSAGNVQLGGRFTQAMLGTVNRNGGSLFLSGTLDLTGDTLALSGANQSWTLQGGTILGGTVSTTNGAQLIVTYTGGTLDGVTINGDLNFANDTSVTVLNGLTLNGTADLTNLNTWIYFNGGTQSLTGTGSVLFGDNYSNGLNIGTQGSTFTIGAGFTLRGGSSYNGGGRVVGNYNVSIVNQGTINADAAGRTIRLLPGDGTGTFTNTGTINVLAGNVQLGGRFTQAMLGTVNRSGGSLILSGTLDHAGDTLSLSGANESWTLQGGTILGGTITSTNGAQLIVTYSGGTLNGVTLNGDLSFASDTYITVQNGLTLNGTATLTNQNNWIYFNGGSQSLTGTGIVVFGDNYSNGLNVNTQGSTFTIGPGITLRGGSSYNGGGRVLGNYNVSIVNQGTINADTASRTIRLLPGDGTGTFTNTGTINVLAGNVQLGGRFSQATLGTVHRSGGSLLLSGTLDNTGNTLSLSGAAESWTLQGGTILGGTVTATSGAQLIATFSGGTLDGVTLNGNLSFASDTYITVLNGLTLNGTAYLTNPNNWIYFNGGTQSLSGTGTVIFGDNYSNGLNIGTQGATFTIGAGLTLQGGSSYNGGGRVVGSYNVSIVNQGTINANAAGRTIRILPGDGTGTFTNTGLLSVGDQATLDIAAALVITDPANLSLAPTGTLRTRRSVTIADDDPTTLSGTFQFYGQGTAQNPQLFEVRSQNLGATQDAFFNNAAIAGLSLSSSAYVRLVDQADNAPGSAAEALYARSIVIPSGTTLDLNGLTVYTTSLQQSGAVVNGTINLMAPIPALSLDQTVSNTLALGQTRYYQIPLTAGLEPVFQLTGLPTNGIVEMYIKRDGLPTRTDFDWSSTQPFTAEQTIAPLPLTTSGNYYILLYAPSLATTPASFQLKVSAPIFEVRTTTFGPAGNAGDFTLKALGANFDATGTVRISRVDGFQLDPETVITSHSELFATFDLTGVAPGTYDVVFTNRNGVTITKANSLTVVAAAVPAAIVPKIIAPAAIRRGREFSFTVEWKNTSLNDAVVPLLTVGSTSAFGLAHGDYSLGTRYTFLGINTEGGPAGILRPGQTQTLTFWSYSDTEPGEYTVFVDRNGKNPNELFDWAGVRPSLIPTGMSDSEFEPLFQQLRSSVGETWGDYLAMLSRNASLLPPEAGSNRDPGALLHLELDRVRAEFTTSLSGVAISADPALPVAGLLVTADNLTTNESFSSVILADNTFLLGAITPGTYRLRISGKIVSLSSADPVIVQTGAHLSGLELTVDQGLTISGQVQSQAANTPIPDAHLWFYGTGGEVFDAVTDSQGKYAISGLIPQTYTMQVDALGRARSWMTLDVTDDVSSLITHLAAESKITGSVQLDSQPAENAFLVATRAGETFDNSFPALFDGPQFVLEGLPEGTYTLHVIVGETVEVLPNIVVGATTTLDLGVISLSASNALSAEDLDQFLAAFDPILEGDIIAQQAFLQAVLIPALYYKFGSTVARLWNSFINSTPYNPTPEETFRDGSEVVEGNSSASGFRNDPKIQGYIQDLLAEAAAELRDRFLSGALTCAMFNSQGEQQFPLDQLLSESDLKPDINFNTIDSIPGNIAGGTGGWNDRANGTFRPDSREFSGQVVARIINGTTLEVTLQKVHVKVVDTIDFDPGNLSDNWMERVFTIKLRFLEQHQRAYGVPFVVEFDDKQNRTFEIGIPEQDCTPPEPPPPDDKKTVQRPVSFDPNDIIGPAGAGPLNHITADSLLPYTIRFENAASAGAPAATVVVTQNLDPDLDWTTFRLGDMGFGETIISVPANTAYFQTRVDLRSTRGVFVDVTAGIDPATGVVRWEFVSIDPATGTIPEDPFVGFLPPNITGPQGEGFLNYTIRALSSVTTGTRIDAEAPIVFDLNDPILTPPIFHTIDRGDPTSQVQPLPAQTGSATFTVSWTGNDDAGGSGIATYDLYVSENGGSDTLVLDDTSLTSFEFTGTPGQTYAFYTVATDLVGHHEVKSVVPDTVTTIQGTGPHAPVVESATFSLAENPHVGDVVGSVSASDLDGDALTFSLIAGNDSGAFAIHPVTGVITVANPQAVDFETHPVFELSVRAQDSTGLSHAAGVTITVTDVDESLQLDLGGGAVTWTKKQAPVVILPQLSVLGSASLVGGTLTLQLNAVGSARKMKDLLHVPDLSSIGSSSGAQYAQGQWTLQIQLSGAATLETVQAFLRGLTFATKGKGLKSPTRTLDVELATTSATTSASQTIHVQKKAPKAKAKALTKS